MIDTNEVVVTLRPVDSKRFMCHLCGKRRGGYPVRCETDDGFIICEECIREGNLDVRLDAHIQDLREAILLLEAMRCRIVVPTWAEWKQAAADEDERRARAYYDDMVKDNFHEGLTYEEFRAQHVTLEELL